MPQLILNNPRLGQRSDGGLRDDALAGLRRLVNYDLLYGGETVDLEVRKGYTRWNAVEFSSPIDQIEVFVDQQLNKHLLANVNAMWYNAAAAGVHNPVSTLAATPPQGYSQWGNRAFLGTDGTDADDPGIIWTDHGSLIGSPHSYRLGIKRPTNQPSASSTQALGFTPSTYQAPGYVITPNTAEKIALCFQVPADMDITSVNIGMRKPLAGPSQTGSIYVQIQTDNAGEPSGNMVADEAISEPVAMDDLMGLLCGQTPPQLFKLKGKVELTAGTVYWIVIYGDDDYYDHYIIPLWWCELCTDISADPPAFINFPMVYGNVGGWGWNSLSNDVEFRIGGLQLNWYYDYVITYLNSTYQSESRPSEYARVTPSGLNTWMNVTLPTSSDPQVDKIRVYRREVTSPDVYTDDVLDKYHYVGEGDPGTTLTDVFITAHLGAQLQTLDHYCLDDVGEEGSGERTEVIDPYCMCMWKGRLWVGVYGKSHLHFSKVFEEDGATGALGLSSPDYLPLDNYLEIPEPGFPVGIYPVSNDQLIVHMSNDTAYIIFGGDQSLNPPADFTIVPFLHTNASFGIWAGTLWSHYHVYLSRAGLYMASGVGLVKPEYLSEENQSILDLVTNANLDDSIVMAVGHELWTLFDFDNDGTLDTILILDMQRDIPTRQLLDRAFRMYQYNVGINDLAVVTSGEDFQQVYAADADNGYILELRKGDLDHETAITAWFETHDLVMPDQAMIYQIDLDGWYPDESNIPIYTWLLTDHAGNTQTGIMDKIKSNEDVRGHRSGVRLKGAVSVRAKVTQVSVQQDRLRGFVISHGGE